MIQEFKALIVSMFMAVNVEATAQPAINIDNIDDVKEIACLSQAVHGEAGNQSMKGKIAVAYVIMNRKKHEDFPGDVCKITHQKGQFDFFKNIRWKRKRSEAEQVQMEDSVKAASMVWNGQVNDPTRGALYFANPKVSTDQNWLRRLQRIMKIGDHVFYRKIS